MYKLLRVIVCAVILLAITTPAAAQDNVVIKGRDVAVPIIGSGLLIFGDTTHENVEHGGPTQTYASNTGARFNGRTADPINSDGQLWTPISCCSSTPTGAMRIGGTLAVWNIDVTGNTGHVFNVAETAVAISTNGGASWTNHLLFTGNDGLSQMTPYQSAIGGYIYFFATSGGRMGTAHAMRVSTGQILSAAAYQYWNGQAWSGDRGAAVPVNGDTTGELSISYNSAVHGYLIMYMSPNAGGLVYATARTLTSPWSATHMIQAWGSVMSPAYGNYAPQQLAVNTGKVVAYLYSHYDDYSVRLSAFSPS